LRPCDHVNLFVDKKKAKYNSSLFQKKKYTKFRSNPKIWSS